MKHWKTLEKNEQGHLMLGGCDVVKLAEEFGTPLYVMEEDVIRGVCRGFYKRIHEQQVDAQVCYAGKVLCYPAPRGSGGFMMYGWGDKKPAAFVHTEANDLTVAAAMCAYVPAMTDFEEDPLKYIETGDMVLVNADEGYIEITKAD